MTEPSERLRNWIRDFGHEKQPAFIADLTAVLDELDMFRQKLSDFSQQQYVAARREKGGAK